jgi:NTE family protein
MQRLVTETDWNDVFVDRPPRGEIAIRRKLDDYKNLFAPEFGLRDGTLLLPKGLVAGVSIESLIRKLTEPAVAVGDFERLPVPFRAVATDIESGEAIILRAAVHSSPASSMVVPGAISPVEIDGRLLVDGGIANNTDRSSARYVRRCDHRGKYPDSAADARGNHVGSEHCRPANQFSRQGQR